jgi:hypothetical protein
MPSIATDTLFSEQIRKSRAPSAPRSGFALDFLICSEATVAVVIEGPTRTFLNSVIVEVSNLASVKTHGVRESPWRSTAEAIGAITNLDAKTLRALSGRRGMNGERVDAAF